MAETPRQGSNNSPSQRSHKVSGAEESVFPGEEKDHDPSRRSFLLRMVLMTAGASLLTGRLCLVMGTTSSGDQASGAETSEVSKDI
ncbi:hypothetical protein Q0F98_09425 [Paenibacillus amylolyticus]|nr:hypothetical protein Q0F98_09425 [Paenibacillus amylolyticus]